MTLQQPRSRQEAKMLGLPDWQIDQMFPGGGLLDLPEAPPERIEAIGGLLGPEKPKGYFQGGDFRPRDGLSLLLASVADGMARNSGYEASTGESLFAGRSEALDEFKKRAEQERKEKELRARMTLGGLTPEQQDAAIYNYSLPEREKPPAIGQTLDYYMQNIKGNPEKEAAFKEVQSILNPKWITGADQLPYQVNGGGGNLDSTPTVEDGHSYTPGPGGRGNPANWKKVGGGTGNGVGGF